jgi:aryl-alcohol dehydrogenase-like predicted oxidoreductase
MSDENSDRREFLQAAVAASAALGVAAAAGGSSEGAAAAALRPRDEDGERKGLPTRPLGRTGQRVSMLCLGGWHIGAVKDEKEAIRIMHRALDEGMTFFDNAWDYHDGGSEEVMGKALSAPGKRKQCFLMTKNCARDARVTQQHIEDSLRRLRTDVIDLVQFHEINYDNDPDWIVERGALRALLDAKRAGKVRYIGFTGHKDPRIHLAMLAKHDWDTVQMPINVLDYHYRSFIRQVVPEAKRRGIAPIGMKSLGGGQPGRFITHKVCTVEEALSFALSQDIASLVTGIDSMRILEQNLRIARAFRPMEEAARTALLRRVAAVAGDGRHERFKSTQLFDGPYHQRQHSLTPKDVSTP